MTKLVKSRWESDGDQIRFSVPLSKVDQSNRLVSGWATLDNVDTQGDIVSAEASARAFARARGNLREMHQPIAVGKIVSFREDEFYNEDDGNFYRGIFVTARVSEGAESTWLKVLDGTLTGFSIGGSINDASNEMSKDSGKPVRIVKDFDLVELSLVDNPANQLSNIFSIAKAADGSVNVEGMVAEMTIENVFLCKNDGTLVSKSVDAVDCPTCANAMENIGWFEQTGNSEDRAEKVRETVHKFRTPTLNKVNEGGEEMAEKETTSAEESAKVEEVVEDPNTPALQVQNDGPDAIDGTETEEEATGEDVEEVTDDEEELSKRIDELKDTVKEILEKSRDEQADMIKSLETKVEDINESFLKKASELENKLNEFGEKLEVEKSRLADFEKKLDKFNDSEAFRKSADVDGAVEKVQKKTTWDGAFSIDNLR